ncbi:hypothetical protein KOW79_022747 [Hemibagrus wyckioides]|uniref:Uncharacterized protein n=1 Tax=Hemibagrus wyckioides TaxID=337641 RepID=A0A9D3N1F7_9TELE|nr:hypothetical protein KOW79_022747 [Hemibagrus wyckioides]
MISATLRRSLQQYTCSSTLEQIKQKPKEKGMLENTTVTWRVQPDGNIFQKINNLSQNKTSSRRKTKMICNVK